MNRKDYITNLSLMTNSELTREHESVSDVLPYVTIQYGRWKGMLNEIEKEFKNRN